MNKSEFMKELSRNLTNIPVEEMHDISIDYDEYFIIGVEKGRSEEYIALSLGEPKTIAKQLRVNYMIEKAQNTETSGNIIRAVIAAVGLGLFNIIFILGPFIGCGHLAKFINKVTIKYIKTNIKIINGR